MGCSFLASAYTGGLTALFSSTIKRDDAVSYILKSSIHNIKQLLFVISKISIQYSNPDRSNGNETTAGCTCALIRFCIVLSSEYISSLDARGPKERNAWGVVMSKLWTHTPARACSTHTHTSGEGRVRCQDKAESKRKKNRIVGSCSISKQSDEAYRVASTKASLPYYTRGENTHTYRVASTTLGERWAAIKRQIRSVGVNSSAGSSIEARRSNGGRG